MKQISIAIAACGVLLVGCGSEPGEADVKAALLKQIEAAVGQEAAKEQQTELDALNVIGCKKAESNGYVCDWTGPSGGASGRLVKGNAGWVLVGLNEK
ncbi:hypothetical protein RT97_27085 [Variovorax paradoxus]|uniref:Lipoprotein n=1 Tax=Variovorax paradoxus TaxID=34073 RepID=A0A0D0LTP1_VARPD|nr:hypothetical protein [Variovorax paradoxus]KIQ21939.1 hypothetical protein RT97_27085 [Variovorax paradoxus]